MTGRPMNPNDKRKLALETVLSWPLPPEGPYMDPPLLGDVMVSDTEGYACAVREIQAAVKKILERKE